MFCHKKHPLFTFSELTEKKGPCSAQSSITAREFWQVTQIGTWVGKSDTFYIHHKRKILRNNFSVGIFFPGHWTSNTHNSLQWTFLKCQLRSNTFCIDTHVIWVIFYFYQMFASIWGEEVDNTMIINTGPHTFIFWWNFAQEVFLRKINDLPWICLLPWFLDPPPPGFVILKGVWNSL